MKLKPILLMSLVGVSFSSAPSGTMVFPTSAVLLRLRDINLREWVVAKASICLTYSIGFAFLGRAWSRREMFCCWVFQRVWAFSRLVSLSFSFWAISSWDLIWARRSEIVFMVGLIAKIAKNEIVAKERSNLTLV